MASNVKWKFQFTEEEVECLLLTINHGLRAADYAGGYSNDDVKFAGKITKQRLSELENKFVDTTGITLKSE